MATASVPQPSSDARRRRIVQNVQLVWVDPIIDSADPDAQHTLQQLRTVVNEVTIFNQPHQGQQFLKEVTKEKVLVITSGSIGREFVPQIHFMPQVDEIYIFCRHKSRHNDWAQDYPKIKGIHTQIESICKELQSAVKQCNQDSTSISFIHSDASSTNLNQLEPSFMYTQLFKDILLDMEFDETNRQQLVEYVRETYDGNQTELNVINEFERDYDSSKAIWWYTRECFTYQMLNRALRQLEADIIVNMGFFLDDLHRELEKLHREQIGQGKWNKSFSVYRGQGVPTEDFDRVKKTQGGLMSFNSFLSTSVKRGESLHNFATPASKKQGKVGILFVIAVDPTISSTPFADIQQHSFYQTEAEVLFSMHTVFRVGAIKDLDHSGRLFEVQLALTADNDEELQMLTERINQEVKGDTGWKRIGSLLVRVGQLAKAEELYLALLEQTREQSEEQLYYNQLGIIKNRQGHYEKALQYYQKSLDIRQRTLPNNHPHLATSYDNIGLVYSNMREYPQALSFHEKALGIYQKTLPDDDPDLAISYNNIGLVYSNMEEYPKALSSHEKALSIRQRTLPANHPSLAVSYNNIGAVYFNMGQYPQALSFYEKALDIRQKVLPTNHPDVAQSYNNIGLVYSNMEEYPKALSSHEKALSIRQRTLPANHPSLAASYINIGAVYFNMWQYPQALSFYEKALDIRQKVLPTNHPDVAQSYNNIGRVYRSMEEYSKALTYFQKALDIWERALSPTHPHMQDVRQSIKILKKKL